MKHVFLKPNFCFQALEEYVLSTEIEVPVYFAEESEDLVYLAESLQGLGTEKSASAAQGKHLFKSC